MVDRVRVFISSTFADLRREREYIAMVCDEMGLEAMYYPERSTAGSSARDFIERLQQSHILIYMATRESRFVEDELRTAEFFGLPIIELAELQPAQGGAGRLITDIAQQRRAGSRTFQGTFDTLDQLGTEVKNALSETLWRRFSSGLELNPFGPEAYRQAQRSMQSANYRLGTAQETSTLVLGPRRSRAIVERRFYREMRDVMNSILEGRRELTMVHVFDAEKTKQAYRAEAAEYEDRQVAVNELIALAPKLDKVSIKIAPVRGPITAAVIHDASIEMATVLIERHYLWLNEVGGAAKDLWELLLHIASDGYPLVDYLQDLASFGAGERSVKPASRHP